jgi:hypothetical protein
MLLLGLQRGFHGDLVIERGHVLPAGLVEGLAIRTDLGHGLGSGNTLDGGNDVHRGDLVAR